MNPALQVHPKRLAEALENAAEFSDDTKGLEVNDSVWVSWTGETIRLMGRGRYSGGLHDLAPHEGDTPEPWSIIIHIDDAIEVARALKKVQGAGRKDAAVYVRVVDEDEVAIYEGESLVASLLQLEDHEEYRGDDEHKGLYEELEYISELPRTEAPPTEPIVWTRGVIKKLLKVRVGDAHHDADRFECHWIGGATWAYRIVSPNHKSAFVAMMESTRDNLE